jgi:hypothetical protein
MNRTMLLIVFAQRLLEAFISKQHSSELSKTENEARRVLIHFRRDPANWLEDEKGDVHQTE